MPPDAEYVVVLPDWGGLVSLDYGARKTGRAASIVVLDEGSNVAAFYQGQGPSRRYLG